MSCGDSQGGGGDEEERPSTSSILSNITHTCLVQGLLEGELVVVAWGAVQGLLHRGDDAEVVQVVALPLRDGQEPVEGAGLADLALPDREVVDQVAVQGVEWSGRVRVKEREGKGRDSGICVFIHSSPTW